MSYNDLKQEFNMVDDGDPWGNAMSWWFAIADELEGNRELSCPDHWEFRMSPLGPENDSYQAAIVNEYSDAVLIRFGNVLCRYVQFLKYKNMDY